MSRTTLGFVWVGMLYLMAGVALGIIFLTLPQAAKLRTIHVHLNLVGGVIFFIFGVAYHILPRFRGRPLFSERLAWLQFLIANLGLLGLLLFQALEPYRKFSGIDTLQAGFGALLGFSFLLFIYNMGRTLWPGQRT